MNELTDKLKKAEFDFSNFSSPENLLGLSTVLRKDGKTMTADVLESAEAFQSQTNLRKDSVNRLLFEIVSGKRWEEIQKIPEVQSFLKSPE